MMNVTDILDSQLLIADNDFYGKNKTLQIRGLTPEIEYWQRNLLLYSFNATSVHNYPYYSIAYFEDQDACFRVIRHLHQRILYNASSPDLSQTSVVRLKIEFVNKKRTSSSSCDKLKLPFLREINSHYLKALRTSHAQESTTCFKKNLLKVITEHPKLSEDISHLLLEKNLVEYFVQNHSSNPTILLKTPKRGVPKLKTGFLGSEFPSKRAKTSQEVEATTNVVQLFETTQLKAKKSKIVFDIKLPDENSTSVTNGHNSVSSPSSNSFGTFVHEVQHPLKHPVPRTSDFDLSTLKPEDLISDSDLANQRISPSEWCQHSAFKNYHSGEPSHSLYVKNLNSRKVTLADLYSVFAKFIDLNLESHRSSFDIILLKSGRLRGQAFVSFPSESIAQDALNRTNGFLLHGKPMVVSFSRNKKPN